MSVLNNDTIQEALLDYYQSKVSVTGFLDSIEEIKELQWQGKDFNYPGVRIGNLNQVPVGDNCGSTLTFDMISFSNEESSFQCNAIGYNIANESDGISFTQTGISFSGMRVVSYPSSFRSMRTWQNTVKVRVARVSVAT